MRIVGLPRYALRCANARRLPLTVATAAALLIGCGGSQASIGVPGAIPQPLSPLTHADSGAFQILYTFLSRRARKSGWGAGPPTTVNGRFFGTTSWGGATNNGAVYTIEPSGKHERVIYSFRGSPDGALAGAALLSLDGALYGTTVRGGFPILARCLA